MKTLLIALALALTFTTPARADLLIYKLATIERHIGGGLDYKLPIRAVVVIDMATFDLSLLAFTTRNGQKLMLHYLYSAVDIGVLYGANNQTHTAISIFPRSNGTFDFDAIYLRGQDKLIPTATGYVAAWPTTWTVTWPSIASAPLRVTESKSSLTYLRGDTIRANDLGIDRATLIAGLKSELAARGYLDFSPP